jgi:O-antigen ligase
MKEGFFIIMIKLSFVVLPMVFFGSSEIILKKKELILSAFIWGLLTAIVLCYINAFYQAHNHANDDSLFNFDVWNIYPNKSFLQLILTGNSFLNYSWLSAFIHVGYFSMYIAFALYIVYQRLISYNYNKAIYTSIFFVLLITMVLLQSRASLIALFGIIFLESIKYFFSPGKRIIKVSVVSGIFAIILLLIFFSGRFNRILPDTSQITYDQFKANNVRLQVWEKTINIIKDNPLLGVGTGDAHDTLKQKYTKELLNASNQLYLNVHNEFLETTMRLGIPGLLFLIGLIIFPLFGNKKKKSNYNLIVVFVLLTIIEYLFESMMVRLNGVIFFAFFYSLLNLQKTET